MLSEFSTTLSAKWILCGEHAVVRQQPAIVFPLPHFHFTLNFQADGCLTSASTADKQSAMVKDNLMQTIELAIRLTNAKQINVHADQFSISNTIPIGRGLGASAALCLSVSQWLTALTIIHEEQTFSLAKQLENQFHGLSSGLDIVGVGAKQGFYYRAGDFHQIKQCWQPHWYFSMSDNACQTDQCVEQVHAMWQKDPDYAQTIDRQMTDSVTLAQQALQHHSSTSLQTLANAMFKACECFERWGLLNSSLQTHINILTRAGAIACKPTGSGGGGGVISLWPYPAPAKQLGLVPLQSPARTTKPEVESYD